MQRFFEVSRSWCCVFRFESKEKCTLKLTLKIVEVGNFLKHFVLPTGEKLITITRPLPTEYKT